MMRTRERAVAGGSTIRFLLFSSLLLSLLNNSVGGEDLSARGGSSGTKPFTGTFTGPNAFWEALAIYGTNIYRDEASEALYLRGLEIAVWEAARLAESEGDSMQMLSLPGDGVLVVSWGYPGTIPVRGDYDGDESDDLAVYNVTNGNWHIRTLNGTVLGWGIQHGGLGMSPVPGDYNGDGKSDLAVYQSSDGKWYIRTVSGIVLAWGVQHGGAGMVPVFGDYNGDGQADMGVYRTSDGRWFIRTVSGQVLKWDYQWGYNGAVPVAGDYDGDGISDLVVCDTNSYVWYGVRMSGTMLFWNLSWGYSGCRPMSGSYDTSGVSHLAVYVNEGGQYRWFVRRTNTNAAVIYYNRTLGVTGDWVAPGDYEGYGLDYLGVYRPAAGTWHILVDRNTNGISDGWEYKYFNALGVDPNGDPDNDGLTNIGEYDWGVNPLDADSDDDGLTDGAEVSEYETDPGKADTDGDGLTDGQEVIQYGTNPRQEDSDGDRMPDGWEVTYQLDPLNSADAEQDADGDYLWNREEWESGTNPQDAQSAPSTRYVDVTTGNDTNTGTLGSRFRTIGRALQVAQNGEYVLVFPGTYTGAWNRALSFWGKSIRLRSVVGATNTVIDGGGVTNIFQFTSGETRAAVVKGFRMVGGVAPKGGGIYCLTSSPSVVDCVIEHNTAVQHGAGIYIEGTWAAVACPLLSNCVIRYNHAMSNGAVYVQGASPELVGCAVEWNEGGGLVGSACYEFVPPSDIYLVGCSPTVSMSSISFNRKQTTGSAIHMNGLFEASTKGYRQTEPVFRSVRVGHNIGGGAAIFIQGNMARCLIENGLIIGNRTEWDCAGVAVNGAAVNLKNTTLAYNKAGISMVGGAAVWVIGQTDQPATILSNCVVWGNLPRSNQVTCLGQPKCFLDYTCCEEAPSASYNLTVLRSGTIITNPLITLAGYLRAGSPVRERGNVAGAATNDIQGEARPEGTGVDMGCDEFVDRDGDTLADWWESKWFGGLTNAIGNGDNDGDGLANEAEYATETDPQKADTDEDGLSDGAEVNVQGSDPLKADTDGDGIPDGWEVQHGMNPLNAGDGNTDSDEDGMSNYEEYLAGTNTDNWDTDGDGISDGGETDQGYDPLNPGNTPAGEWFVVVGDLAQDVVKERSRTVHIPAGQVRLIWIAVHSEEFPSWTGQNSPFNDVLAWDVQMMPGGRLSGQVSVNDRHNEWLQGTNVLGFEPAHFEHKGILVAPLNTSLTVRITLSAKNVGDGKLPSTIIVGLPVLSVDLEIYKPKVVDPAEPMIPDADELSKGSVTFVNLDNDDNDSKFDHGGASTDDEVTGGDDELVKVKLKLKPSALFTQGQVKLLATAGASNIAVWTNDNKVAASAYTLGTVLNVPGDFTVEGDSLVKTMWVEGISAHTAQQGTKLKMEYSVNGVTCDDEAALTVVGVDQITWKGKGNSLNDSDTLDADQNWPGALTPNAVRVFPDARIENSIVGPARDKVNTEVSLTVASPHPIKLYMKSFDTDDPTADRGPVDSPGTATNAVESTPEDNRSDPKPGQFSGQDQNGIQELVFEAGVRITNCEFQVTMQPGDNFRVVANGDRDFLLRLENNDSTQNVGESDAEKNANKQRICNMDVTGTPAEREIRLSGNYASDVLTVWRFLHVEVDSMAAPPSTGSEKNFVEGTLTGVAGNGTVAQRVYLSVNLRTGLTPQDNSANLTAGTDNGRFENGWIKIGSGNGTPGETTTTDLLGNGDDYVRKDAGINIPAVVSKEGQPDVVGNVIAWSGSAFTLSVSSGMPSTNYNGGALNVAGVSATIATVNTNGGANVVNVTAAPAISFVLHDDDDDMLLPRNLQIGAEAQNLFAPAYVRVVQDGGGNPNNNCLSVPFQRNIGLTNLPAVFDLPNALQSRGNRSPRFWCGYVLYAFQFWVTPEQVGTVSTNNPPRADIDPNRESDIRGLNRFPQGTILFAQAFDETASFGSEQRVLVHELAHQFGVLDTYVDGSSPLDCIMGRGIDNPSARFYPEALNFIRSKRNGPNIPE